MKALYRVKRISLKGIETPEQYWAAVKRATAVYCTGLDSVRQYCGGSLHRSRTGVYCGTNGNIEYIAERIH